MAGPWFAVHRVGSGWKTLDKIWISNGEKADVAIIQTRVRFADDKGVYQDDAHNPQTVKEAIDVLAKR